MKTNKPLIYVFMSISVNDYVSRGYVVYDVICLQHLPMLDGMNEKRQRNRNKEKQKFWKHNFCSALTKGRDNVSLSAVVVYLICWHFGMCNMKMKEWKIIKWNRKKKIRYCVSVLCLLIIILTCTPVKDVNIP